jgi:hypothetical protein
MLYATSSGCALPFAPPADPTGAPNLTALAAALAANADGARLRRQLLELQLPLFGGCLGGRKVCSTGWRVQFDPEPGE